MKSSFDNFRVQIKKLVYEEFLEVRKSSIFAPMLACVIMDKLWIRKCAVMFQNFQIH